MGVEPHRPELMTLGWLSNPRIPGPGIEPRGRPYESRLGACHAWEIMRSIHQRPVRESNPPLQLEGLTSLPIDQRAVSDGQCVGQELNLQSPKAGGLRPPRLANAQPTHRKPQTTQRGFEPTSTTLTGRRALRAAPRGRHGTRHGPGGSRTLNLLLLRQAYIRIFPHFLGFLLQDRPVRLPILSEIL